MINSNNLTLDHPDNVYDPIHASVENLTLGSLTRGSRDHVTKSPLKLSLRLFQPYPTRLE